MKLLTSVIIAGLMALTSTVSPVQSQKKDPTEDAPDELSGKFFARRYMTESRALNLQSKKAGKIEEEIIQVSDETKRKIRQDVRVSLYQDTYTIHKIYKKNAEVPYRYAIHLKQPGQHKFMDLMYGVNRDGTINRIDLMVYREPHGMEVQQRRFMAQFEDRSLEDSQFRVNLDVIHIAGATISAKSVARGTRKVLALLEKKGFTES